ncbi:DUF2523 domain-containing protein [Pseudomonas kuykendallii]|uniref:DUF2523 domain-containing protein n=1 Tax=Pseudomonas kuykendallii TaxID=1007099 RepID=UPI0028D7067B|nr:DUF2523 domain-containing protein [Pseudomonas kuykendallii]
MQFLYGVQLLIMILMPLIQMVMKAIGIGFVSYLGSNLIIDQAMNYIVSKMSGAGAVVQQILGLAKIDVAINIYFSAITTRMVLSGLNKLQDRKRAQVWRAPGGTSIEA